MLPLFRRKTQLVSACVCVCVSLCALWAFVFLHCARSRKLNTTLLLTRLPELNSGQKFVGKNTCQLLNTVPAAGYGMRSTSTTRTQCGARAQNAAQLHMSKLNGFRLPADNKNGCFHITNMLYASLMLLRFTNISVLRNPPATPFHPQCPGHAAYHHLFYVKISAEYGFIAGGAGL